MHPIFNIWRIIMHTKNNNTKPQMQRSFFIRLFLIYLFILLFSLGAVILIWRNNIAYTVSSLSSFNIKDVFSIANSNFTSDLDNFYNTMDIIATNDATLNYLKSPSEQNAKQLRTYLDNCCFLSYNSRSSLWRIFLLYPQIQGIQLVSDAFHLKRIQCSV